MLFLVFSTIKFSFFFCHSGTCVACIRNPASLFSIWFTRAYGAEARYFSLLVQRKVPKRKDTRAGAILCREGLFALSGFDSPSWLSKTGRDVHVALFR
jgi:hypothetical protein